MRGARLRAWTGLVLAGLSLADGASAQPQAPGSVVVERRGAERLEVDGGKHATAVFRLRNGGDRPVTVQPRLLLPDGWRTLGGIAPVTLAPGAADVRILPFSTPASAPAGRYTVTFEAGDDPRSRDSVVVDILPRVALDVILLEAPAFVVAGESYDVLFRVQNHGNSGRIVSLDLRSGNFEAEVALSDLSLAPGESRQVSARVHIDPGVTRNQRQALRLQARTGAADAVTTASASAAMDVLPAPGGSTDHLHRLPLAATLRATPDGGLGGEIAGSTRLAGGRGQVDLLLRRPEPGASAFGWGQDVYRLRLQTPGLDIRLGDHVYALSSLTRRVWQGFGVGAAVTVGRVGAEAFAERDRRGFHPGERAGGALRLRLGGSTAIAAHHVVDTGRRGGHTASVRGETRLGPLLRAEAEYGLSAGESGGASAHVISVGGAASRLGYSVRHIRGDTAFLGAYSGSAVDAGQLRVRPVGQLWLHGSLSLQETTDRVGGDLRGTRQLRLGARYGSHGSAEYRWEERQGMIGGQAYGVAAHIGGLQATLPFGPVQFQPRAEVGATTNLRTLEAHPYRRLRLSASARDAGVLSLSASLEHVSGSTTLFRPLSDRVVGSMNVSARIRGTSIQLIGQGTHTETGAPLRGHLDLRLDQALPFGHQLGLRGRMNASGDGFGDQAPLLAAQYTIPLSIPIGRRGEVSRVVGRVYDAETGAGVGDVLVRLGGRSAITDRRGHLAITGSEAGMQHLRMDRQSAGLERVIDRPGPLEVRVREGRTTRVDLPLVRAARVTGQIRLMAWEGPRGGESIEDVGGLPSVLVEISRGDEVHRRVSDANGRFEFPALRPGDWRISVDEGALPPHHDWEEVGLDLQILAGETEAVVFRQVPRRRNVVIMTEGELVVTPTDAEPTDPSPPAARPDIRATVREEAAAPREAARGGPVGPTVTVVRGDRSVKDIARLMYEDASLWPRIWLANRDMLGHPARVFPGQVLRIPPAGPLTPEERAAARRFEHELP